MQTTEVFTLAYRVVLVCVCARAPVCLCVGFVFHLNLNAVTHVISRLLHSLFSLHLPKAYIYLVIYFSHCQHLN